jgi:hypothetical protein
MTRRVAAHGRAARSPLSTVLARALVTVAGLWLVLVVGSSLGFAQAPLPAPESPTTVDLAQLTPEERANLLSRLSDEQVRALLLSYLREQSAAPDREARVIDEIDREVVRFRE